MARRSAGGRRRLGRRGLELLLLGAPGRLRGRRDERSSEEREQLTAIGGGEAAQHLVLHLRDELPGPLQRTRPFGVIDTSHARRSPGRRWRLASPASSSSLISLTMALGSMPMSELSWCWMDPSRAPSTLSSANSAGVRPIESSFSAVRVCEARHSRKKSWPANSATSRSLDTDAVIAQALQIRWTDTIIGSHHNCSIP